MREYDFVGLQEMYPLGFRMLFALLGEPRVPTLRKRVNESGDEARLEPDPDLVREIETRNALDLAIYQVFLARWRAIRETALAYPGARPRSS